MPGAGCSRQRWALGQSSCSHIPARILACRADSGAERARSLHGCGHAGVDGTSAAAKDRGYKLRTETGRSWTDGQTDKAHRVCVKPERGVEHM